MRIVVTGATGFLGREVARRLRADHEVLALGRGRAEGADTRLDLRDAEALAALLRRTGPDAVVHLAAWRDPDRCEADPAGARRVNVGPVAGIRDVLPPTAPLLFVSSDYVFDGTRPPYGERDARAPVNVYGATKRDAEDLVLAHPAGLVLRVPLLVGAGPDAARSGFLAQLAETLRDPQAPEADHVLVRYPTWTRDVAEAIAFLLDRRARGACHFSGPEPLTRYDCVRVAAGVLGLSPARVRASRAVVRRRAARPVNSALSTERLRAMGFTRATPLAEVVRSAVREVGLGAGAGPGACPGAGPVVK